jgi:hypothetical protein
MTMAEDVRVTNMPGSGSPEAVALDLWKYCGTINSLLTSNSTFM